MLPQAPDILSLIGFLQCILLQTTFFRPLESFSIYSVEYISLSAVESWCPQKIYLSSAGGTGCHFFFGMSSCSEEALHGLSTVTFEPISFPAHCSLWVMALPAVCEEREPMEFFLCFVISKSLFA